MLSYVVPVEASLNSLDTFEHPTLFISFNTSLEQKTGPVYAPKGPTLDIEVLEDRNIFIDCINHLSRSAMWDSQT